MTNPDPQLKITYRRWIILIPILMILMGMWIFYEFPRINPSIALLGGLIAFIGVITLSILLFMLLSIELSARALVKKIEPPVPFSEKFEGVKQVNEDQKPN